MASQVEGKFKSAVQIKFGSAPRIGVKVNDGSQPEDTPGPGSYWV